MSDFIGGFRPSDNFSMMANHWFRDPRLLDKEKGRLGYLATHAADYRLTIEQQIAETKDGRDSIYASLKRLTELGYLVRLQERSADGKMGAYTYAWGPAVREPGYVRAWGRQEVQPVDLKESPGQTASGLTGSGFPASGSPGDGSAASGLTGSGPAGSGQSALKKNNPKKTRVEKRKDQPPLPPTQPFTAAAPTLVPTQNRGGEFPPTIEPLTPEEHAPDIATVAAELVGLAAKPQWTAAATAQALADLLAEGRRTWPTIVLVARRAATDPGTLFPGRLVRGQIPEEWWAEAARALPKPERPDLPWCGSCESDDYRWVQLPTGYARCTACNPRAMAGAQ